MPFCIALPVCEMGMTPSEALRAATDGGAAAPDCKDIGTIAVGIAGELVILNAPSYVHLAYRPGIPLIDKVPSTSPFALPLGPALRIAGGNAD